MEVPPTFSAPPPPKRTNTLLIVILVILGLCVVCCGGVIFLGVKGFQKMSGSVSCMTHYVFALQATKDYANAHGGKMPDAKNWQDEIAPYYGRDRQSDKQIKNVAFLDFGDPSKNLGCPGGSDGPETGIAYNSDLAGKPVDKVREDPSKILFFETPTTARNQSEPYKAQPGNAPQTLFGQARPWWTMSVGGQASVNTRDSSTGDSPFHQGI